MKEDIDSTPARRPPVILIGAAVILALMVAGACDWRQHCPAGSSAGGGAAVPASAVSALVSAKETRPFLNTAVTITVIAQDEAAAKKHIAAGFALIAHLQQVLNAHAEDSELAAINAAAGKEAVKVSDELFDAIHAGVRWHQRTRGVFDITVMPLVSLWRECGKADRLPTESEIARARGLLGADRIEINEQARTVRLPVADMRLDLGGMGKGYIVDRVASLYRRSGVAGALIAASGDIYAMGRKADGKPWRVGIQDPRMPDSPAALLGVLDLSDMAVSTSGNYERFVMIQGKRHSHIVDPRSGQTADAVPSVTVVGPDALTTDILDTSLSVLGVKEGLDVLKSVPRTEAVFILLDEKNTPVFVRSPGFKQFEGKP